MADEYPVVTPEDNGNVHKLIVYGLAVGLVVCLGCFIALPLAGQAVPEVLGTIATTIVGGLIGVLNLSKK